MQWACNKAGREIESRDRVFYTAYPDPLRGIQRAADKPAFLEPFSGKLIAAFTGIFGGSYNFQTICEVAEKLHQSGDDRIGFVLAGDGEHRQALMSRCSSLPNVLFPGWLSADEINALMKHADIALVPCESKPDTMPNKLYEGLAQGLPVVSSLVGEAEEWIAGQGVGLNYSSRNADELYAHLTRLADSPIERKGMGRRARQLYEQHFSDATIYSQYARFVMDHVQIAEFSDRSHGDMRRAA